MERINNIQRSVLWDKIYAKVKELPRAQVEGDALDHRSLTTNLEELFLAEIDERETTCLHSRCIECNGTGIKKNSGPCVHFISCPCKKCSPFTL